MTRGCRWLEGRLPYLRHGWAIAAMVGADETDLWPQRLRTKPDVVTTFAGIGSPDMYQSLTGTSAAQLRPEDLLRALSKVRLGLKRGEKREVPPSATVLPHTTANQLQGWPELSPDPVSAAAHQHAVQVLRCQAPEPSSNAATTAGE